MNAAPDADLQRELAELRRQRDAAMAQTAALGEVLRGIAASPDDPQPVFDLIARRARELCGAPTVALSEFDGAMLRLCVFEGEDPVVVARGRQSFPRPPGPDSLMGQTFLANATLHFRGPEALSAGVLAGVTRAGSNLYVPLRRDGRPIGILGLGRVEEGGFSDAEVALVESFAGQASLAMAGAARQRELRESLEQQTATAEVLSVINRSPGDLAPVFEAILEKAHTLCGAVVGSLVTYDGEFFRAVATNGFPDEHAEIVRQPQKTAIRHEMLLRGERYVHVPDLRTIEVNPDAAVPRSFLERTDVRTCLLVPLRKDSTLLGFISAFRLEVRPFTEKEIALLENFAAQAVIAMENARLLTEQQEALERQTATAEVLQVINASPGDLAPVFEAILEKARRICRVDHGSLVTFDGTHFRAVATRGYGDKGDAIVRTPRGPVTSEKALLHGARFVHIPDFSAYVFDPVDTVFPAFVKATGFRAHLVVPLRKDDVLLGHISAWRRESGPFSDKEIALLENFAAQAVIAMENARLLGELRERTAELAERNDAFGERIEHQAATIDVLKEMSASPGDPQPVFDLIVRQARAQCGAWSARLWQFDGTLVHFRAMAAEGMSPDAVDEYSRLFPRPVDRDPALAVNVAIREQRIVHIRDADVEGGTSQASRNLGNRSGIAVPLLRGGQCVGAIGLASPETGGFSDTQVELLRTFAEQAVIAIGSAETYRALQDRTATLAERNAAFTRQVEYQAATIDVLKAMSASPSDPQPVFDIILRRAMSLCDCLFGGMHEFDSELIHIRATQGFTTDALAAYLRPFPMAPKPEYPVLYKAILNKHVVYIRDIDAETRMSQASHDLGHKSIVAVPLLRDDVVVGVISLGSPRVNGFTDAQLDLLKTFAEQAAIAMSSAETYRALQARTADLQESLEYQTATSDVLKVISRSTFDLQPVLDTLLATGARLCDADWATMYIREGDAFRAAAAFSASPEYAAVFRERLMTPTRGNVSGRAVLERRFVHVADVTADLEYTSTEAIRLGGTRTALGMPLLRESVVIGVIILSRRRVQPFTDRQIELVGTFADQAVIAIENTRLLTEQQEALEQQIATSDVLQVINASPGDLAPVFDTMLEKAMRLCEAAFGSLSTYDGELFHVGAMRGVPPAFAEFLRKPNRAVRAPTGRARIARGENCVHIADLTDDEVYRSGEPGRRALTDQGGARTAIWVALRKDGQLLGVINIYRTEVRPFSDKQIALLENFAAQAVIALENARLLTEQREALEQQTATAEILRVINANPGDPAPVFDAILEKSLTLAESAFGSVWLYDGSNMHAGATRGMTPALAEFRAKNPLLRISPFARQAAETGRSVQIPDVRDGEPYKSGNPGSHAVADLGGARTMLLVPLTKERESVGCIQIYRQEVRAFTDKQIALLESFAAQAVIAMDNARLITEQREALEQQTATAEVLQVINASPGNLAPVFDAVLEKAMRLCGAAFGELHTFDGENFLPAALIGLPPAYAEFRHGIRPVYRPGTMSWRIRMGENVLHIEDLMAEQIYRDGDPQRRAMVDLGGARTTVAVALRKDETLLGSITIFRQEVRPFSDRQVALLQNFAAQAVIAMENARLITEQREALERQTATAEVLGVINASPGNLQPVFDAILEKAHTICGSSLGNLLAFDGAVIRTLAWRGAPPEIVALADQPYPPGPAQRALIAGERLIHIPDIATIGAGEGTPEIWRAMFRWLGGHGTYLVVPLRKESRIVGFINAFRSEVRAFSDKEIALLENFASQAVIAMDNARLIDEIRAARDHAEATLRELKIAQANLVQAEKMASLGQLTAGIAHEIKNPLNFVNNFAALSVDLLEELKETAAPGFAALTDEQRADIDEVSAMLTTNLQKIEEHGKRADGIVKAMLEHSRGSSGERREVDLNGLVGEALNLAFHGARANDKNFNITLERDYAEGIAPIEVNPQDLTRLFLNLFSNGFYAANKRARDGGEAGYEPRVRVSTIDRGDHVEVRVRDNGTGIPPDIRDKLFQPFFTTKPTGEGTGLGLSITYDIVTKQHGGAITVDSEVGAFTEFVVSLPRHMFAGEGERS